MMILCTIELPLVCLRLSPPPSGPSPPLSLLSPLGLVLLLWLLGAFIITMHGLSASFVAILGAAQRS